ncbi:MAG: hypothetical protein JXD22_01395 [Sedimentisphaerales bacterium]|nr:hypothetical protein [Sedimentisphaerales bacterium]
MCSKSRFVHLFGLIVLVFAPWAVAEDLRLPKVFTDHMVLQQQLPVVIWGWADAGEKVTVSFAGQNKTAGANGQGVWRVELSPLKASVTPAQLTVKAGDETIVFNDVLIGEVWLCSGQSNMAMTVGSSNDAENEIATANYPLIRHIMIERVALAEPVDDVQAKKGWEICSPETVGGFTAAGYYFGRELFVKLDVPIGLLHSSWGGSNIESFTSLEGFKQVPELSDYVTRIESSLPGNAAYKKAVEETIAGSKKWIAQAQEALKKNARVAAAPVLPASTLPLANSQDPTSKHNAMIEGLVPYRIRGSIWYQGESNRNEGMLYVKKTEALVKGWRLAWGQPDLPYYFVQIAPFNYGEEDPGVLATFWEAQEAIEMEIPHTGMVVINDVGDYNDIHPKNKQAVGYRLAAQALANTYHKDVVAGGPQFEKMKIEGNKLRVFFRRTGSGLITRDGKSPDWFEIAGDDGVFVPAVAVIDGDTVVLSNADLDKPALMRYAWAKNAEPNLKNKEGFPVSAFRAGKMNERALLDDRVEQAKEYELVFSFDIGNSETTKTSAAYRVDRAGEIGKFDRVGYFLALKKPNEAIKYVWVSMDAFTKKAPELGIPAASVNVMFRQWVEQMEVVTNVEGVKTGKGLKGYIEFWPNNYSAQNSAGIDGASNDVYDFGDTPGDPRQGYGSMQVHNPEAGQTVFATNNWAAGPKADVGIGNSPEGHSDYTFQANAGQYELKRLMVLVRPKK